MMYMMSFLIRSQDPAVRERLGAAIKLMGNWSNRFPDMWLLEPSRPMNAAQIRDQLRQFLGDTDSVFVARISRNWAGRNMGQNFPEWMNRRDFGTFTDNNAS